MGKQRLRDEIKEKLLRLDKKTISNLNRQMAVHLFQTDLWKEAETIGITISGGIEWDTEPIIKQGWKEGKQIAVPKCLPDKKELQFYQLKSYEQLEVVYFQLQEPNPKVTNKVDKDAIDLLIVPGIVYDRNGYRIGFGGGYYDRFLSEFPNQTASILYTDQLIEHVPKESYDIPVQVLITENGLIQ